MIPSLRALLCVGAVVLTGPAHALQWQSVSPQSEVGRVRELRMRFDSAVVRMGDAQAQAPADVQCEDPRAAEGAARWLNEREWVHGFTRELPPGTRCTATIRAGLTGLDGSAWVGRTSVNFGTGGPVVQRVWPGEGAAIDEDAHFVLRFTGPVAVPSVVASAWCMAEGIGERVPVRVSESRASILQALKLAAPAAGPPENLVVLACNRRLPAAARVQLVVGRGVTSPKGVVSSVERRLAYRVRPMFKASVSCERENAQADCMPIRPVRVEFSSPLPRALAEAIRLRSDQETRTPTIEAGAGADSLVEAVQFAPPFGERTAWRVELPQGLQDAAGRGLANAASFPLVVRTGPLPPLAKFAAAPFGIVERHAEGPGQPALLPLTVRRVEPQLGAHALDASQARELAVADDAAIVSWLRKVQDYHRFHVPRERATREVAHPLPKALGPNDRDVVQSRMVSLLEGQAGVRAIALPKGADAAPRPFEVLGIPLAAGFHVVEIRSPLLGAALLDPAHGPARALVARTSVLVTNLAVHFKLGREGALAWVTTLDGGKPVGGAQVRVADCHGRMLKSGTTDTQGVAVFEGLSPQAPSCAAKGEDDSYRQAYFVSARTQRDGKVDDLAFTFSDWQRGIEPWRFNLPTSLEPQANWRAHTIVDRRLLRSGETVSMKHFFRVETARGLAVADRAPTQLTVRHVGSGQTVKQAVSWRKTATGGLSAESEFKLAPGARLGQYEIELADPADSGERSMVTGEFRVEAFRLPLLGGAIQLGEGGRALVAPTQVPVQLQVRYLAGGAAAQLPTKVSALVRGRAGPPTGRSDFGFDPPRAADESQGAGDEEESSAADDARVILDQQALTLDRQGGGRLNIERVPAARTPQELIVEASYADPNGEIQTLRQTATLWPAGVIAGIKAEGWVSTRQAVRVQALALDLQGKPQADVPVQVRARARVMLSTRKRLVGGFYAYDNRVDIKDLGTLCEGRSDARGLLLCEAALKQAGEVELIVSARDAQGRMSEAAQSVWITREGELWFGGDNHDRIDVLPERKAYRAGETARLQVRMPFRHATALVTVEREGILHREVVTLRGTDPTLDLKVRQDWGPNVYVSVLALRGRLSEVPWYSLFTWGWRAPREWWTRFWYDGREYLAPTALVDLAKPAYRFGVAELDVGSPANEIQMSVKADRETFRVRETVRVTVQGRLPGGAPAAGAEVALAVVDEALLELLPNPSWDLLAAMWQRRPWGVETSTAQMEIVGRRHYGRKALPAGGGGGRGATRELFDTLLAWHPRLVLDARGQAQVDVPLSDALTQFRIVAAADAGAQLFGSAFTKVRTHQDLQIVAGLAPVVREDDRVRATFTVRNTTSRPMKVDLTPRATGLTLAAQRLEVPAGEAREAVWEVTIPAALAATRAQSLIWELHAQESGGKAADTLKFSQRVDPAVPLSVQQASIAAVEGSLNLDVAPPPAALPGRGGLRLVGQARLTDGLASAREWWLNYPFTCLEQRASKAVGLRDAAAWRQVVEQLPSYLDGDGLAAYFPLGQRASGQGSDVLSAYLLSLSAEMAALDPAFAWPDDARRALAQGLAAFVEGRVQRPGWAPRRDLDVRKLAAVHALARHGLAQARQLASITLAPREWPTHALLDWIGILRALPDLPQRDTLLADAQQNLRARLSWQGTQIGFSSEREDLWWWTMAHPDANAARLLLAAVDDPAWRDELPRLVTGLIARQQRGAWQTTVANAWAGLALARFSARHESAAVSGQTLARLGGASGVLDWARAPSAPGPELLLPWAGGPGTLAIEHRGSGRPWLTAQTVAAVPVKEPVDAGYRITRTLAPVEQAVPGRWTRGDVVRVTIEVAAATDMAWVVLNDPIPAGASILGSGLGRDSQIATQGERRGGAAWVAFEERGFDAFRAYYERLPRGTVRIDYTIRLNSAGDFGTPPTRVEAMYAPEVHGALPGRRWIVEAK